MSSFNIASLRFLFSFFGSEWDGSANFIDEGLLHANGAPSFMLPKPKNEHNTLFDHNVLGTLWAGCQETFAHSVSHIGGFVRQLDSEPVRSCVAGKAVAKLPQWAKPRDAIGSKSRRC